MKRVATQGKYPVPGCITPDSWVTSYIMQFRQDTRDWWNYTEEGKTRVRRKKCSMTYLKTFLCLFSRPGVYDKDEMIQ